MKAKTTSAGRRDFLKRFVKPKATGAMTTRKDAHGDDVSLLGYGMMRFPTVDGKHANTFHGGSKAAIDREEYYVRMMQAWCRSMGT